MGKEKDEQIHTVEILLEGNRSQQAVSLNVFVIGRDQLADVQVNEKSISRKHLRVAVQGAQVFVTDLNSRNGTYLKGIRIPPLVPTPYLNESELLLGTNRACVKLLPFSAPSMPVQEKSEDIESMSKLENVVDHASSSFSSISIEKSADIGLEREKEKSGGGFFKKVLSAHKILKGQIPDSKSTNAPEPNMPEEEGQFMLAEDPIEGTQASLISNAPSAKQLQSAHQQSPSGSVIQFPGKPEIEKSERNTQPQLAVANNGGIVATKRGGSGASAIQTVMPQSNSVSQIQSQAQQQTQRQPNVVKNGASIAPASSGVLSIQYETPQINANIVISTSAQAQQEAEKVVREANATARKIIQDADQLFKGIKSTVEILQQRADSLRLHISRDDEKLKTITEKNEKSKSEVKDLEDRILRLNSEYLDTQNKFESLKSEMDTKIRNMEATSRSATEEMASKKELLRVTTEEFNAKKTHIDEESQLLTSQVSILKDEHSGLTQSVLQAKTQLSELQNQHNHLSSVTSNLEKIKLDLYTDTSDLKDKLSKLKIEVDSTETNLDVTAKELQSKQEELKVLQQDFTESKQNILEETAELTQQLKAQEAAYESLEKKYQKSQKHFDERKKEEKTLEETLQKLESQKAELQSDVTSQTTRISELHQMLSDQQLSIQNGNETLEEINKETETLKDSFEVLKEELTIEEGELRKSLDIFTSEYKSQKLRGEAELEVLIGKKSTIDSELESLTSQKSVLENEFASLKKWLTEKRTSSIDEVEREIETVKKQSEREIALLRQELEMDLNALKANTSAKKGQLLEEIQTLQEKLRVSQDLYKEIQTHNSVLEQETAHLQEQCGILQRERQQAEEEIRVSGFRKDQIEKEFEERELVLEAEMEAAQKAKSEELNIKLLEHKNKLEMDLTIHRKKETEKIEEQVSQKLKFLELNREQLIEIVSKQIHLLIREKIWEEERDSVYDKIFEKTRECFSEKMVELKNAGYQIILPDDRAVSDRSKNFWFRTALTTSSISMLVALPFIFPAIPEFVKDIVLKKSNNRDLEPFLNIIRDNQRKFKAETDKNYKDNYTENVLRTENYVQMKLDDTLQRKWVIDLNEFFQKQLRLGDQLIVRFASKEISLVKELIQQSNGISVKYKEVSIKRMNETEEKVVQELKFLLNGDENYKKFREFEASFYLKYILGS